MLIAAEPVHFRSLETSAGNGGTSRPRETSVTTIQGSLIGVCWRPESPLEVESFGDVWLSEAYPILEGCTKAVSKLYRKTLRRPLERRHQTEASLVSNSSVAVAASPEPLQRRACAWPCPSSLRMAHTSTSLIFEYSKPLNAGCAVDFCGSSGSPTLVRLGVMRGPQERKGARPRPLGSGALKRQCGFCGWLGNSASPTSSRTPGVQSFGVGCLFNKFQFFIIGPLPSSPCVRTEPLTSSGQVSAGPSLGLILSAMFAAAMFHTKYSAASPSLWTEQGASRGSGKRISLAGTPVHCASPSQSSSSSQLLGAPGGLWANPRSQRVGNSTYVPLSARSAPKRAFQYLDAPGPSSTTGPTPSASRSKARLGFVASQRSPRAPSVPTAVHKAHLKRERAAARKTRAAGTGPAKTFLRRKRVGTTTEFRYKKAVQLFERASGVQTEKMTPRDVDPALEKYLVFNLFFQGETYSVANYALSAVKWTMLAKSSQFPMSSATLKGFKNQTHHVQRDVITWEETILQADRQVDMFLKDKKNLLPLMIAAASLLAFDLYCRVSDLFQVVAESLLSPLSRQDRAGASWCVVLFPEPDGKTDKMGRYDSALLIAELAPDRKWLNLLVSALKASTPKGQLVFPCASSVALEQFKRGLSAAGLRTSVLHMLRHGGPSLDALNGVHIDKIRERGRWLDDRSVARYKQHGKYFRALHRLSASQRSEAVSAEARLVRLLPALLRSNPFHVR